MCPLALRVGPGVVLVFAAPKAYAANKAVVQAQVLPVATAALAKATPVLRAVQDKVRGPPVDVVDVLRVPAVCWGAGRWGPGAVRAIRARDWAWSALGAAAVEGKQCARECVACVGQCGSSHTSIVLMSAGLRLRPCGCACGLVQVTVSIGVGVVALGVVLAFFGVLSFPKWLTGARACTHPTLPPRVFASLPPPSLCMCPLPWVARM